MALGWRPHCCCFRLQLVATNARARARARAGLPRPPTQHPRAPAGVRRGADQHAAGRDVGPGDQDHRGAAQQHSELGDGIRQRQHAAAQHAEAECEAGAAKGARQGVVAVVGVAHPGGLLHHDRHALEGGCGWLGAAGSRVSGMRIYPLRFQLLRMSGGAARSAPAPLLEAAAASGAVQTLQITAASLRTPRTCAIACRPAGRQRSVCARRGAHSPRAARAPRAAADLQLRLGFARSQPHARVPQYGAAGRWAGLVVSCRPG